VLIIPRDLVTAVPLSAPTPGALAMANPNRPVPAIALQPQEPRNIEINGNGLPQRRRGVTAPLGGSRGQRSLTAPRAPLSAGPAGSNGGPAAPPPGLWLAAFQNAVAGDGTSTAHPLTDDASSKEGE
jgi:hypothetical protein